MAETLLSTDRTTAVTLEPLGDGKIRVRTSTWDQKVVILADQALEIVALGKSLRLIRAPRPLEFWTTIRSDLPTPDMARSNEVTASHR